MSKVGFEYYTNGMAGRKWKIENGSTKYISATKDRLLFAGPLRIRCLLYIRLPAAKQDHTLWSNGHTAMPLALSPELRSRAWFHGTATTTTTTTAVFFFKLANEGTRTASMFHHVGVNPTNLSWADFCEQR